jgi:hypothetical protein
MAARQGFHDEIVPASMALSVRRGTADARAEAKAGVDMVVLPVTIEIAMTHELRAELARK